MRRKALACKKEKIAWLGFRNKELLWNYVTSLKHLLQEDDILAQDYKPKEAVYAARDRCGETVKLAGNPQYQRVLKSISVPLKLMVLCRKKTSPFVILGYTTMDYV